MDAIATSVPAPSQAESLTFSYVARPGLLKLTLMNLLLSIITLGFYRFWARTNVRKHIWSCVHINGEPMEYTGTGMELFKGFLVVFVVMILPLVLLVGFISFAYGPEHPAIVFIQTIFFFAVYVLWGFAIYKARKYQLSRTNWRGIRGALVGSAMTYSLLYFGSLMAKGMSFGWATPVMNTVLQEQIINDMRFGDAAFKFKGRAGPLYPTYALCWLLTLGTIILAIVLAATSPFVADFFKNIENSTATDEQTSQVATYVAIAVLGMILAFSIVIPMLWSVYVAKEMRVFADYTRFDGAPFVLDASAGSIITLTIGNLLLLIFTIGIAWPFIQQRVISYVVNRLSLVGAVDIDRIGQSKVPLATRGEGLADAFDVGGVL